MNDIETRTDLEFLLSEFYKTALKDELIGHHFDDLDLQNHLPIIVDFWEKVLFGKPVYFGNPMIVHKNLHEKFPLEREHFDRWVEIFVGKTDENFRGHTAEEAKLRAASIAISLNKNLNETAQPTKYHQIKPSN